MLGLSQNGIGNRGLCALSDAIRDHHVLQSLQVLRLTYNAVGDDGAVALLSAMSSGSLTNLCFLRLTHNEIGDEGMNALLSSISRGLMSRLCKGGLYVSDTLAHLPTPTHPPTHPPTHLLTS